MREVVGTFGSNQKGKEKRVGYVRFNLFLETPHLQDGVFILRNKVLLQMVRNRVNKGRIPEVEPLHTHTNKKTPSFLASLQLLICLD